MRTDSSLTVKHAELVGSNGVMEDRLFIGNRSVVVLDGATQADQNVEQTGGWIADQIGRRFSELIELNPDDVQLVELLANAIANTRDEYGLVVGKAPSTTVSAARFTPDGTDLLVLGDSPALYRNSETSDVHVLEDTRLQQVTSALTKPSTPQNGNKEWRDYYRSLASLRNHPDGFWIVEANPTAATHAITRTVAPGASVLLCTDGVSSAVDTYKLMNWQQLFGQAQKPEHLIEQIQSVETSDPQRTRYPRSKVSDDKLLISVH